MVFESSWSIVLVEVWYSVDLVAFTWSHRLYQFLRVSNRYRKLLHVLARSQNVVVRSSVVHVTRSLSKLRLFVKTIHLSRLSVGSVSFLLDLVCRLSISRCMVSFSESNFRAALVVQFLAVKDFSRVIHISAYCESTLFVWEVMSLNLLSIFISIVVVVERLKHLTSFSFENSGGIIETSFLEHVWIVCI